MTKAEMITLKMNLLGGMNDYVKAWLGEGVADDLTEDDLRKIAENEDKWAYICRLFGSIVENEYVYRKRG